MRRLVWMTLQALGMLSLSACFTLIDFELGDGGAAAQGGAGGDAPTAGGTVSIGGGPPTTGGGGGGGGGVGGACDGCVAELYFTAASDIVALGVGGPHVVLQEGVSTELLFLPTAADAPLKEALGAMKDTGPDWDSDGQGLGVDDEGAAYYSPQGGQTLTPIVKCKLGSSCGPAFEVPEPSGTAQFSLNDVQFHEGYVYGVSPSSGKVWRAQPTDEQAQVYFTLTLANNPLLLGYRLALGGGRVANSTFADPNLGAPTYLGVADTDTIPQNGYEVPASEVMFPWRTITSLAIGEGGTPYARVFLDDGSTQKGIVLRGNPPSAEFAKLDLTNAPTASTLGGLVADETHVYFFGESNGLNFMRCSAAEDPAGDTCVSLFGTRIDESLKLFSPGPVAANDTYVYFADGKKLYRVAK